jgi:hypothetical protein
VPRRDNPKSWRADEDEAALIRELMEFYGVKSETELYRMAFKALNRERLALEELYVRPPAKAANRGGHQGKEK